MQRDKHKLHKGYLLHIHIKIKIKNKMQFKTLHEEIIIKFEIQT